MRTYYITSLAILTLVFLVSSCTEIIDIDINASDPEMVVEATIGMDETANVVLTRTIGLDDTNDFSNVENVRQRRKQRNTYGRNARSLQK